MARQLRSLPMPWKLRRPPVVAAPLAAGTVAFSSSGPASIVVTESVAYTGGVAPVTRQWQRNTNGGSYSNLSGQTGTTCTDTTAVAGNLYGYKLVYTDGGSSTATSNVVTAQIYTGGSIGGGSGGPRIGSQLIRGVAG